MAVLFCDQCWAENDRDASRCQACGADLTAHKGDMVERMVRALRHPLPEWRAFAAEWLGRADDERAVVALCRVAEAPEAQEDLDLLPAIASALGRLGQPSATYSLARLARHPFLGVRAAAVRGLAALGTPSARHEVEQIAASDSSSAVRECAREALQAGGQTHG